MPPVPGAASSPNTSKRRAARSPASCGCCRSESGERIEVRRLMSWFNDKFFEEVSGPLVTERVYKRFIPGRRAAGRQTPRRCARRATILDIIWPISAGWSATAIGLPAIEPDLCRSRRGGAFIRGRLSGRCAVGRRRERQDLVREGKVATRVPHVAAARRWPVCRRRPATPTRLLIRTAASLRRRSRLQRGAEGFELVRRNPAGRHPAGRRAAAALHRRRRTR